MSPLQTSAYLEALRSDGAALARAARGDLGAPVGSCPGWDVAELVWHTAEVHSFWRQIAERSLQDFHDVERVARPGDEELVDSFERGVERLAEVLERADPAGRVWTWAPQKDVAFIQRRMAQETAVHRWDAQAAVGAAEPIDAALAVDGVDEFFDFMLPDDPARLGGESESVHLHATDAPGEWLATIGDGGLVVERSHAKGDAAARAPASDLVLLLWRRRGPDDVEVIGDREVLERFLRRADLS
jgi:uncharacterized protein (TIGR03083 family)